MAQKNADLKQALGQLEETLKTYMVKKAPFSIPENWKELIVQFAPYLTILGIIVSVPAVFAVLGLGALVSPFTAFLGPRYALSYSFNYVLSMVALVVVIVLAAMAVPGLFKREEKAWRFLFYASLVNVVSGFLGGDWVGMIIGALLSWYVLFQVKEYYK
jgi:hypothetical protein